MRGLRNDPHQDDEDAYMSDLEPILEPIFEKERRSFYRLWHVYHSQHQIPYSHDEKERFFNSLLEIFKEDSQPLAGGAKQFC